MTTETRNIAELIERVMTGDPWHGPSVTKVLEGVTSDAAAWRPPPGNAHSIWELVLHMTGWAREVTARLGGRAAREPEAGDWPGIGEATTDRWLRAQSDLCTAHRDLAAAIRNLNEADLTRPVLDYRESALGTGLSHYVTLHGLVHHTIYHAGQIAMLRRLRG